MRRRPSRTPITSIRTPAQLPSWAASHRRGEPTQPAYFLPGDRLSEPTEPVPGSRLHLDEHDRVGGWVGGHHVQFAVPAAPVAAEDLNPSPVRWSVATCSPSAPSSPRVNVVIRPPCGAGPTTAATRRADSKAGRSVIPSREMVHSPPPVVGHRSTATGVQNGHALTNADERTAERIASRCDRLRGRRTLTATVLVTIVGR